MDFNIKHGGNIIIVNDLVENIEYYIHKPNPCYINYIEHNLYIPLIAEIIKSYNNLDQFLLDNHYLIREYIKQIDDIISRLPVLSICKLPEYEDNYIFKGIKYRSTERDVNVHNSDYRLDIYVDNLMYLFPDKKYRGWYKILGKVEITNQPYNRELLFSTIKSYIDNHLYELINLFKPINAKSARKLN